MNSYNVLGTLIIYVSTTSRQRSKLRCYTIDHVHDVHECKMLINHRIYSNMSYQIHNVKTKIKAEYLPFI